jgi:hypothetical protein
LGHKPVLGKGKISKTDRSGKGESTKNTSHVDLRCF